MCVIFSYCSQCKKPMFSYLQYLGYSLRILQKITYYSMQVPGLQQQNVNSITTDNFKLLNNIIRREIRNIKALFDKCRLSMYSDLKPASKKIILQALAPPLPRRWEGGVCREKVCLDFSKFWRFLSSLFFRWRQRSEFQIN